MVKPAIEDDRIKIIHKCNYIKNYECEEIATFGFDKAEYCEKHKKPGMEPRDSIEYITPDQMYKRTTL